MHKQGGEDDIGSQVSVEQVAFKQKTVSQVLRLKLKKILSVDVERQKDGKHNTKDGTQGNIGSAPGKHF
jgi:hypothetical protein